jgi:hypothetical protein
MISYWHDILRQNETPSILQIWHFQTRKSFSPYLTKPQYSYRGDCCHTAGFALIPPLNSGQNAGPIADHRSSCAIAPPSTRPVYRRLLYRPPRRNPFIHVFIVYHLRFHNTNLFAKMPEIASRNVGQHWLRLVG